MGLAPQNLQTLAVNLAATGPLVPAAVGARIIVVSFLLMIPAAMVVKVQDGAADRTGPLTQAAAWALAGSENQLGHWQTSLNTPLNLNISGGTGNVVGWISFATV